MKKINGTWFEFLHLGQPEGKYFNPYLLKYTPEQWKALLSDIKSLEMEYLVILASAYDSKTFYTSPQFEEFEMNTKDAMRLVYETAEELDLKIFVANDFFGMWQYPDRMIRDKEIMARREKATVEIAEMFGKYKSFYGWYWPNEAEIYPYYEEEFIEYVNQNSALAHQLTPGKKTLIAPYGTFRVKTDDHYVKQLERMDVDIIAYQDEIGVKKAVPFWTPKYFENLRKAHDRADRCGALWADMEVFTFEGDVYTSALLPAPFERIKQQLQGIQDFVDEVLIFEYQGMMSRPGSIASTGLGPEKLYSDYTAYLTEIKKKK